MKGTLVHKEDVAKGTGHFKFSVDEDVVFVSGQYFHILLREGVKHHFTIVNSPNEKRTIALATRMRDTEFKNTLKDLSLGSEVEIYKIKGEFVLPESLARPFVFVALGIGITPYVSMLRYMQEQDIHHDVTLIYSDSDKESMAFLPELEAFAKANANIKLLLTITSDPAWTGETRHVDEGFIEKYITNPTDPLYFVSGPPQAVESVVAMLAKLGVPQDQVKSESFSGY